MGLFHFFKRITAAKYSESGNQKMPAPQRADNQLPEVNEALSALIQQPAVPEKDTFVCGICRKEYPAECLHGGNICETCAEELRKPVGNQVNTSAEEKHNHVPVVKDGEPRPEPIPAPSSPKQYCRDPEHYHILFQVSMSPYAWIDSIVIDVRNGTPYYMKEEFIDVNRDCVSEFYISKIDYDTVRKYRPGEQYRDLNENTWQNYVPQEKLVTEQKETRPDYKEDLNCLLEIKRHDSVDAEQLMKIARCEGLSMLISFHEGEKRGFIFEQSLSSDRIVLHKLCANAWDVYWESNGSAKERCIHTFDTQQDACQKALKYARTAKCISSDSETEPKARLLRWSMDEAGLLTFSGSGPMPTAQIPLYYFVDAYDLAFELEFGDWTIQEGDLEHRNIYPWREGAVRKVIFEAGLTDVGESAIGVCTNVRYTGNYAALKEIVLSDTVESLKWNSIYDCPALEKVVIPAGVTSIYEGNFGTVFTRCPKLTIHTPKGSYAESFAKRHNIPVVTIPDTTE